MTGWAYQRADAPESVAEKQELDMRPCRHHHRRAAAGRSGTLSFAL